MVLGMAEHFAQVQRFKPGKVENSTTNQKIHICFHSLYTMCLFVNYVNQYMCHVYVCALCACVCVCVCVLNIS